MIVFEVHLVAGHDGSGLLSEEMLEDTKAQVMTVAEAAAVGFSGVPDDPQIRLVAVAEKDQRFVGAALERSAAVTGYKPHQVDV
jgi:hypothetical protein